MIDGLIAGKVYGKPEQRTGRSGKTFTTAKVRAAAGDGEMLFVNVVAFDPGAQAALLALSEGDSVSLAGAMTVKVWTDKTGAPRPGVDLVAAQVLTAYHVRRKREAVAQVQQEPRRPPPQQRDFEDDGPDPWLDGGQP